MDTEIKHKVELKDRINEFYKKNKIKLYAIILFFIVLATLIILYKNNIDKKNTNIAENYITAGIYLNSGKNEESLNIYEKILESGNNFYSILALNIIVEKNLISDQKKILNYFNIIEKKTKSKEQRDLIIFKKSLYLLKINNSEKAIKLLRELSDSKSQLSILAKEAIPK